MELIIAGTNTNTLRSGTDHAGVEKADDNGTLTISGTGTLEAYGGQGGAGIGGARNKNAGNADHHTSLTYDPYTSELTLDRSYAGSRADIVHRRSCKVRSQNGALKLRILLDKNSVEVFVNDGEQTMTAWIYTPQSADGITFAADGKATVTVEQFELNL